MRAAGKSHMPAGRRAADRQALEQRRAIMLSSHPPTRLPAYHRTRLPAPAFQSNHDLCTKKERRAQVSTTASKETRTEDEDLPSVNQHRMAI